LIFFADLITAITTVPKTEQPSKEDIKEIIVEASALFLLYFHKHNSNLQRKSKHNMRAASQPIFKIHIFVVPVFVKVARAVFFV
jgi:hypothetical protein